MKIDQTRNPKYWVVHNTNTEDVFIETARKDLKDSCDVFLELYPNLRFYFYSGKYKVSLVELNLVDETKKEK